MKSIRYFRHFHDVKSVTVEPDGGLAVELGVPYLSKSRIVYEGDDIDEELVNNHVEPSLLYRALWIRQYSQRPNVGAQMVVTDKMAAIDTITNAEIIIQDVTKLAGDLGLINPSETELWDLAHHLEGRTYDQASLKECVESVVAARPSIVQEIDALARKYRVALPVTASLIAEVVPWKRSALLLDVMRKKSHISKKEYQALNVRLDGEVLA
ncbi:hypothetical protein [Stenotrophomonas sp. SG1]|uniref:hypothetical protein n=1 Tax=Stenotrophomonas sp. SG1 TaxID=2944932 RepID=UPI002243AA7C|nr:hypothetical protein [Stenotrophomonas sp. SG1]MCW8340551.1 hypothetical protein [Stenotrophomonas sp. SG1]